MKLRDHCIDLVESTYALVAIKVVTLMTYQALYHTVDFLHVCHRASGYEVQLGFIRSIAYRKM